MVRAGSVSEVFDAMRQKLACSDAELCRRPEEEKSPMSYHTLGLGKEAGPPHPSMRMYEIFS